MPKFCDFTSNQGVLFRALLTTEGSFSGEPVVKFYDQRYPHTPNGQFTGASYYVSTLMRDYERLSQTGLRLHGGEPVWDLDARSFRTVANWILEVSE